MDDKQIIDLYFQRSETAITETARKYGAFCHKIALNILSIREDAEECIPAPSNVEQTIESKELSSYINTWLYLQNEKEAMLFIRRYWYGDSVQDLAKKSGTTAAKMAQTMQRLRKSLKAYLEQKGVSL